MKLLNLNLNLRFPTWMFLKNPSLRTRLKILKQEIDLKQPDVICFQELTDIVLLHRLNLMLKGYNFVCKKRLKVFGGVVIFFKKNKWCLKEYKFRGFSKQGKIFSKQLADRILKKGILLCRLENLQTKEQLAVINIHLTANYGQRLKDEERQILKIQLKEILRFVEKHQIKGLTTQIIAGDFNANFQGRTIQNWIQDLGFSQVFSPQHCSVCPGENPLCYRDQRINYLIDNVLVSGFKKISGRLLFNQPGKYISDHYGQLVEIK